MLRPLRHTPAYSQQYRFVVPTRFVGLELIEFYCQRFGFKPKEYWLKLLDAGNISVNNQGVDPDYILKEEDVLHTRRDDVQEPDVNDDIQILHDDDGLFVINKPAPLPVHPVGRYYKNSLVYILNEQYPDQKFHTIHRLDVWTTGTLVLGSDASLARHLHLQVEKRRVGKVYGVLAKGDFGDNPFVIDAPVGRAQGAHRGTGEGITEAKLAETRFTPVIKKDGVTLLRAEPITGRTNQIRVHVQAAGGHVLHDPLYSPDGTEDIAFMGLHCREMRLSIKPGDQGRSFVAPWPKGYLDLFTESELNGVGGC